MLKLLVLQLRALPRFTDGRSVYVVGQRLGRRMEQLLARIASESARPVVVVAPNSVLWDAAWEEVAMREWLDRLEGGLGCWVTPQPASVGAGPDGS